MHISINKWVSLFVCGGILITGSVSGIYIAVMEGGPLQIALATLAGGGAGLIVSTLIVVIYDKVQSRITLNQEREDDIASHRDSESRPLVTIPLQTIHPSPVLPLQSNSLKLTNEKGIENPTQLEQAPSSFSFRSSNSF